MQALRAKAEELGLKIQWEKKLVGLEKSKDGKSILAIADGTSYAADIVIGADGIHSTTRDFLFPGQHIRAKYAGQTAVATIIPASLAQFTPEELASLPIIIHGRGNNGAFLILPQSADGQAEIAVATQRALPDLGPPGLGRIDQGQREDVAALERRRKWRMATYSPQDLGRG